MRELAAEQRRFGYRRLHVLLRAEGHLVNRKKTQRLCREEGLTVRKRKGRKRRFRILNVIDDVTKECLAVIADTSISGWRRPRTRRHRRLAQQAGLDRLRPWNRVHLERNARLVAGAPDHLAFHPAGQADAERDLRSVQWQNARRTAQ